MSAERADVTAGARRLGLAIWAAAAFVASGALVGHALAHVTGNRMEPWILGRATGITAYLLFWAAVMLGLVLSHPSRARLGGTSVRRLRTHVSLVLFAAAFTVFHVVVLATDRWSGVGWVGAVVPMGAQYRPVGVTLGLIGMWLALLAGGSAAAAGRLPWRLWWPLHKVAALALVAVWLHGVIAGGDAVALRGMYAVTGAIVLVTALWRYNSRSRRGKVPS